MTRLEVDLLVIGWGKAGKSLAAALAGRGWQVALVEQSEQMAGGSCINVACIPTKALLHRAEHRDPHEPPNEAFVAARDFRDALTGGLRHANHTALNSLDTVTLVTGHARFLDPFTVEAAAGRTRVAIHAHYIVINTGSRPVIPDWPGCVSPRVHTSTTLQHIDRLPKRLVVVGAGFVGLEFANMFAKFGSDVTVLDHQPRILPREDDDVAAAVTGALTAADVTFRHRATVIGFHEPDREAITIDVDGPGGPDALRAQAVLVAAGRRPATEGLDLSAAGVATTFTGAVIVDGYLRTSQPHIYAVGDVNGGPQFTYISYDDHRIVLDQLTGSGQRTTADRTAVPTTVFLTPPLARVGLNETQARAEGRDVLLAAKNVADIATMPRPKILQQTRGLIKFVIDRETDKLLGATLFCIDAQELINTVALAIRAEVTASQLRDGIWTHPSTTEAFNEVLSTTTRPR